VSSLVGTIVPGLLIPFFMVVYVWNYVW
jgi:hypothetical protein